MEKRCLVTLLLASLLSFAVADSPSTETWVFLDNGTLRLGVNRSAGAAIGFLSESGRDRNFINRFDYGRYVQQSWYGNADGSDWDGKPWRWNPVQAGGHKGRRADVLEFSSGNNGIQSVSIPRHWATGNLLDDVRFSQSIRLDGPLAVIDFEMKYSGTTSHPVHDQELPAVFVDPSCSLLHFLSPEDQAGEEPRRFTPGFPNEVIRIREPWIAWLDESGRGIGILVPGIGIDTVTCYHVEGDSKNRKKGACSYAAPIKRMSIEPGFEFRYTAYLTLGTLPEIRHRFHKIQVALREP